MFGQKNILDEPMKCFGTEYYAPSGRYLNKENAKFLLCTVKRVFEEHGIQILISYGTLLGAIREHDFISHDSDMDTMIWAKDMEKALSLVPELEKYGIKLRSYCLPWVFSFDYKGEGCDVDVLQEPVWPWKKRYCLASRMYIPRAFFENIAPLQFLGETFTAPADPEKVLEYHYGKNWRIPSSRRGRIESYLFFWRYAHRYLQKWERRFKRHILKRK